MTETIRDKIARQIALEEESRALGADRYRSSRPLPWNTDTSMVKDEADLPPGKQLLKTVMDPVAQALVDFKSRIENGGAGRRSRAYRVLALIGEREAAYLTARAVINSVAGEQSLQSTAFAVAALIIEHIEMLMLREANKPGFKGLLKKAKRSASDKRRMAIRKIMEKEGTRLTVAHEEQLHIGMKCIELLVEATGLFSIAERPFRGGKGYYLRASEALAVWLERQHARCELLEPIHMPMIVRPRAWRTPFWGGYLTKRPGVRMVKQWTREYHSELRHVDMPDVYRAINAVQNVRWRINTRVLDVMRQVWDEGGSLGGLPARADRIPPARPENADDDPEVLKAWRAEAATVHAQNARMMSQRLALQRRLWIATKFAEEEVIYFPHELDFRGRIYPTPTGGPHPQGDDSGKSLLEFADGIPLGDTGAWWLAVHIANLFGIDKVPFEERVDWVMDHQELLVDSAVNPLDGQRFWTTADSPYCALAACFEWFGYCQEGKDYVSRIAVALDGSNSGLQHYSAMLRDPVGARAVNLLPVERPQDVYMQVATRAQQIVDASEDPELEPWKGGKVSRKIAKRPTMTYCYSATRFGMHDMILQTLREIDADGGEPYLGGADNYKAAMALSHVIWEAISEVVVAASGAMAWLREVAKAAAKAERPLWWTTPVGLPVLQLYRKDGSNRVEVYVGGQRIRLVVSLDTDELNTNAQANGIAPNFVHSCDAAHLMAAVNACTDAGVTHLALVHDSFGTHAANAGFLSHVLRRTFIDQYRDNILERLAEELVPQLPPEVAQALPSPPAPGPLDLNELEEAAYMFA